MPKEKPVSAVDPAIATYLVAACFVIIVLAGAIVTIVNPDALSFADYVQALALIGVGGGALGIGRGILLGSRSEADPNTPTLPRDDATSTVVAEPTTLQRTGRVDG